MAADNLEDVPTATLSAERCHLGEGPTYDASTDTAWWFDILEKRLFEANVSKGQVKVHALGKMASALARIDAERQLIVAEDGLYIRHVADGRMELFAALEAENPATRSNDARVHPSGTFWFGTMGRKAEPRGRDLRAASGEDFASLPRHHHPERDLLLGGWKGRLFRRYCDQHHASRPARCLDRTARG